MSQRRESVIRHLQYSQDVLYQGRIDNVAIKHGSLQVTIIWQAAGIRL